MPKNLDNLCLVRLRILGMMNKAEERNPRIKQIVLAYLWEEIPISTRFNPPNIVNVYINAAINISENNLQRQLYEAFATYLCYNDYQLQQETYRTAILAKFTPKPFLEPRDGGIWTFYLRKLSA